MTSLQLTGVVETDAGRAAAATGRLFSSVEELMREAHPDLVIVATPPAAHQSAVVALLAGGAHVICEKPLAPTATAASTLAECADASDRLAVVNYQLRYDPVLSRVYDLVRDGAIGRPLTMDIRIPVPEPLDAPWTWNQDRSMGGGVTMEFGSHYIDLAQWMFGPLELATAHVATLVPQRRDTHGTMRPVTTEDLSTFVLHCDADVTATVTIFPTWDRTEQRQLTLTGTTGSLIARVDGLSLHRPSRLPMSLTPEGYDPAHWVDGAMTALLRDVVSQIPVRSGATSDAPGRLTAHRRWAGFAEAARVQAIVDQVLDLGNHQARPTPAERRS